jgi:hypothetical protein
LGCSSKQQDNSKSGTEKQEAKTVSKPPLNIGVSQGETIRRNSAGKRVWSIRWKSAQLSIIDGKQSGRMNDVNGDAFEKDVLVSQFESKQAEADAKTDRLKLSGGVKILATESKTTLIAQKVDWLPDQKVFRASGDVIVEGPNGIIGPTDTLFVTPKLDRMASSESYFKK